MRIGNLSNTYNFTSTRRTVWSYKGNKIVTSNQIMPDTRINYKKAYSNYTRFFRSDLNSAYLDCFKTKECWGGFVKTIDAFFKNANKVHVYDFASSDGSEAYSLVLALDSYLNKNNVEKYYPIKAYDIDEDMVNIAKSGVIECDEFDSKEIASVGANLKDLFNIEDTGNFPYEKIFCATPKLKEKIEFEVGDFQENILKIEPSNSLVLARNFFRYMEEVDVYLCIQALARRLDSTSLIVVGDFDRAMVTPFFKIGGFEEVCPYIFRKK